MKQSTFIQYGRIPAVLLILSLLLLLLVWRTPTRAQTPNVPAAIADVDRGYEIYLDRCVDCHGPTGNGDGEMAPLSPQPPTAFANPDYRLTAVPSDMYDTIVNGRMAQGMPPFGPTTNNPLSDEDIWNAIAVVYSLSNDADTLAAGAELFDAHVNTDTDVDLTDLSLWAANSNDMIAAIFREQGVVSDASLSDEDLLLIVNYARSNYAFPFAAPPAAAPVAQIESGTVVGELVNGTTNETVVGAEVLLRAFTQSLQESMVMTTTVGVDGTYTFDIADVPADWVYLVSATYNGYRFNSQPGMMNSSTTELVLPVLVYEESSDETAVEIEQIHTIMNFSAEDVMQVTQLYRFRNNNNAIFVGESGAPSDGTVEFVLPTGAQNAIFERGLGDLEEFIPAEEVIATETGWADTLPLRPGAHDLLITYQLPYENGMQVAHPVNYPVGSATAILPNSGVTLETEDGWQLQGQQDMGTAGSFLSYANVNLGGETALSFTLDGRPSPVTPAQGNVIAPRNETAELIIGGASLLIVLGAAIFVVNGWRSRQEVAEADREEEAAILLEEIAALDDAYEAGEIAADDYATEREELKMALMALWSEEK